MPMNYAMQKASIERDLKRQGIDPDTVDLHALIDPTLTLPENRANIVHTKRSDYPQERVDAAFCEFLDDECIQGHKEACTEACKQCRTHCKTSSKGSCKGKVHVKRHKRACPPKKQHGTCKQPVHVKAHTRKCPSFMDELSRIVDDIL